MTKNKTIINSRITSYSLVAGTILSGISSANGAIYYTPIDPDKSVFDTTYTIDLNGGGVDFTLYHEFSSAFGSNASLIGTGEGYNQVYRVSSWYIGAFAEDDSIGSSMASGFKQYGSFQATSSGNINGDSNWLATTDTYIGVRLGDGSGDYQYGWIGVNMAQTLPHTITVTGFAYEDAINTTIKAGDKGINSSIKAGDDSNIAVYTFGNQVYISGLSSSETTVRIYDISGKQVHTSSFNSSSTTVDVDGTGIYLVKVESEEEITTHKVQM